MPNVWACFFISTGVTVWMSVKGIRRSSRYSCELERQHLSRAGMAVRAHLVVLVHGDLTAPQHEPPLLPGLPPLATLHQVARLERNIIAQARAIPARPTRNFASANRRKSRVALVAADRRGVRFFAVAAGADGVFGFGDGGERKVGWAVERGRMAVFVGSFVVARDAR